MNIRPSAAIRQNYNEIAELCRATREPVFLTKNGEGDLVVMDIDAFEKREKMLALREALLAVEEERIAGRSGVSLDDLDSFLVVRHAESAERTHLAKDGTRFYPADYHDIDKMILEILEEIWNNKTA